MSFIGKDNLVSVIVPLYNAEDTIVLSLQSVLEQTYTNWEVIVVNDGSTDGSKQVVENFINSQAEGLRLKFSLFDQPNAGPSSTRNRAIALAKGNYIAFLDSDDVWIASKLQEQMDLAIQYPNISIIGGAFYHEVKENLPYFEMITFDQLLFKNYFATPMVFIKKEYLQELDYFFDDNKRYCEDYDLWLRLVRKRNAIFINKRLGKNAFGKANFGQSGLSAHLLAMQKGEVSTYTSLYKTKALGSAKLIKVLLFSYLKYLRRLCVVYLKRN